MEEGAHGDSQKSYTVFGQRRSFSYFSWFLAYSTISNRAPLVAQMVKNLQCRRPGFDPWVKNIPWRRNLLQKYNMGVLQRTHSNILAWRIPRTDHGITKSWTISNGSHWLNSIYYRFSKRQDADSEWVIVEKANIFAAPESSCSDHFFYSSYFKQIYPWFSTVK